MYERGADADLGTPRRPRGCRSAGPRTGADASVRRHGAGRGGEDHVHGARHPELADITSTYEDLRADLEPHLLKEERVLFPMIRELAVSTGAPSFHCGSLRNPISVMLSEHDAVGDLLATLRRLTDGYTPPADGCATYAACFSAMAEIEADTHLHVHKENNLLFPAVIALEAGYS